MKLQVKVLRAIRLTAKDPNGLSDPYCRVYLVGTDYVGLHKTEIKPSTLEPEWKETFTLYGGELAPLLFSPDGVEYQVSGYVVVDVWDHDTLNQNDFLGQVMLPLREVSTTTPHEEWYPLTRRNPKDRVSGSILLEVLLKVDKNKILDKHGMNSDFYQRCKLRGYHLPILSGKDVVEMPGRTEHVEMAFSNVYVDVGSSHGLAQVYLTNYRLAILSNRHQSKSGRGRAPSTDVSTWIALNNIMTVERGNESIVVRKNHRNQKKQKTTSITIHCYDIRMIKLIFALEEDRRVPNISAAIHDGARFSDRLQATTSAGKQLGLKLKNKSAPALRKKMMQGMYGRTQWHADLGITAMPFDSREEFKRTKSEAMHPNNPAPHGHVDRKPKLFRTRSKSGGSAAQIKQLGTRDVSPEEQWARVGGVPNEVGGVSDRVGRVENRVGEVENREGGVSNGVGVATNGVSGPIDEHDACSLLTAHNDIVTRQRVLIEATNLGDTHRQPPRTAGSRGRDLRRSRSYEDISLRLCGDELDLEFCMLTEPDDLDTGYTVIFDDGEMYISDEDTADERSLEVQDLTPLDSSHVSEDMVDGQRMRGKGVMLPRASSILIQAFQQRIESVMVNGIHYPPGLFFVQLYVGYLQLTGWDMYNFPKEMDRQEVSEEKWRLSVQNGPEYLLCSTYPQLMYVPKTIGDSVILESSKFRSKNRLPCLVWVDSKRQNFMLRCAQPLVGKSGKHSLEDEQLIEACLNAGPPDGELVIYDARSMVAATGNMLKGKGTENMTHYPRAKYTYLDIPNIHAVRESFESLRTLCLSSESGKWYSSLENTQWLANLSLIIKGAVMIARYMKLQRGNALVHCSDGWDRTAQLTSLSQLIMDPHYRTMMGFMILIEKEWLAFGHKFQHRLGHPDYPNERSPIFLQFLDCVRQMLRMFPKSFEFNPSFLLRIADHLHTGWFGTFLCNCDKERHDLSLYARSPSLWAHLMADKDALLNHDYFPNRQPIIPTTNLRHLKLWEEYFLRHDSSSITSHGWRRGSVSKDRQNAPMVQHTVSISDNLQESWTTDHVIWVADEKTNECLLCHSKFSAFKRRHHCRACGHIFCDDCSKNKIALGHLGYSRPERVCVECYSKLNAAQKTSDTDDGFLLVSCKDSF